MRGISLKENQQQQQKRRRKYEKHIVCVRHRSLTCTSYTNSFMMATRARAEESNRGVCKASNCQKMWHGTMARWKRPIRNGMFNIALNNSNNSSNNNGIQHWDLDESIQHLWGRTRLRAKPRTRARQMKSAYKWNKITRIRRELAKETNIYCQYRSYVRKLKSWPKKTWNSPVIINWFGLLIEVQNYENCVIGNVSMSHDLWHE